MAAGGSAVSAQGSRWTTTVVDEGSSGRMVSSNMGRVFTWMKYGSKCRFLITAVCVFLLALDEWGMRASSTPPPPTALDTEGAEASVAAIKISPCSFFSELIS